MKNTKGITLVALVITIIILLILAGITISQLTNSGLFNNTQVAKEEYANAQEKEEIQLAQYANEMESYINNDRNSIILSQEQFDNLFSKPDNKLKDMPNTWTANVEYSWGNGNDIIYGKRLVLEEPVTDRTTLIPNSTNYSIIAYGGHLIGSMPVGIPYVTENNAYWVGLSCSPTIGINLRIGSGLLNNGVDIWILYKK